jgi:hypothetical protein
MTFRADFYQGVSYRWMYGFKSLFMVLVVISIWGCGGPVIKFGRIPDTTRLETSLQPAISTRDDVLDVLGEPRNSGGAMLPVLHNSPRDMWVYYYEEGTLTDDRRIFLFVFFKEDRYDGYLWFSSLPVMNPPGF